MEYEIKGWEGYYLFITDNDIKVYSSWGFAPGKPIKGTPRSSIIIPGKRKELSTRISPHGYKILGLCVGKNGQKQVFLHRIIAETLIPNPQDLGCVDHIDGNKLNNHPSNLQWITRGNNVRKAQDMGKWGTPPKSYEITFSDLRKITITNISKFSRDHDYQASKLVAVSKGKRDFHKDIIEVVEL